MDQSASGLVRPCNTSHSPDSCSLPSRCRLLAFPLHAVAHIETLDLFSSSSDCTVQGHDIISVKPGPCATRRRGGRERKVRDRTTARPARGTRSSWFRFVARCTLEAPIVVTTRYAMQVHRLRIFSLDSCIRMIVLSC